MRLIHCKTRELKEFMDDEHLPPYAILSHTWGEDEVSYQDFPKLGVEQKAGYAKIINCCDQAIKDKLDWAWVDTCCIDKSSSAELSEAVNSMFRWYKQSVMCYAYLFDVPGDIDLTVNSSQFGKSRWFTRGWTLQELLAPKDIIFFARDWQKLGTKDSLRESLCSITGIQSRVLLGEEELRRVSVAQKMSWAAKRVTTRTEDVAYCLLGIFDVNMPLLYGEGVKAFGRLQEEILKVSDDQSLFAWGASLPITTMDKFIRTFPLDGNAHTVTDEFYRDISLLIRGSGPLAETPADFENSGDIDTIPFWPGSHGSSVTVRNRAVGINLPLLTWTRGLFSLTFAILGCRKKDDLSNVLGLVVMPWGYGVYFERLGLVTIPGFLRQLANDEAIRRQMKLLQIKARVIGEESDTYFVLQELPQPDSGLSLRNITCVDPAKYDEQTRLLRLVNTSEGPQSIFLFHTDSKMNQTLAVVLGYIRERRLGYKQHPWVCGLVTTQACSDAFSKHLINMCAGEYQLHDVFEKENFSTMVWGKKEIELVIDRYSTVDVLLSSQILGMSISVYVRIRVKTKLSGKNISLDPHFQLPWIEELEQF